MSCACAAGNCTPSGKASGEKARVGNFECTVIGIRSAAPVLAGEVPESRDRKSSTTKATKVPRRCKLRPFVLAFVIFVVQLFYADCNFQRLESETRTRMLLHGIIPPITTPFTPEGEVYFKKLEFNVDRYCRGPIAGVGVLGSTGEAILLRTRSAGMCSVLSARLRRRRRFWLPVRGLNPRSRRCG